ncbi:MAG: kynureninase, partial [Deltaproteobacteria bacterium HGW-Deltaproteobacteria-17]
MRDTDDPHADSPDESHALALDASDPLRHCRDQFHIPPGPDGAPAIYLCGNSLGLQPRALGAAMNEELADWASLGVEGHFKERGAWYTFHEACRGPLARLAGAFEHEVVAMNSLTANLHLMMVSFFKPGGVRRRILIDGPCFPSDLYAVRSQLRYHGIPESEGLLWLTPRGGEHVVRTQDALDLIEQEGETIALVLLAGVNFVTG